MEDRSIDRSIDLGSSRPKDERNDGGVQL